MKVKKILAAVTALSLASVMLASCGSTDDSSSAAAATKETTTTTTEATTTTTAATEESVADESAPAESGADDNKGGDTNSDYTPVKEFKGYDAFLMFGDSQWLWGNWEPQGLTDATQAFGVDAA